MKESPEPFVSGEPGSRVAMDDARWERLREVLSTVASTPTRATVVGFYLTHCSMKIRLEMGSDSPELLLLECRELSFRPRWTSSKLQVDLVDDEVVLSDTENGLRVCCRAIIVFPVPED